MEIMDHVIALLGLLATVIIGTAKITWTLAKEIFRSRYSSKRYSNGNSTF